MLKVDGRYKDGWEKKGLQVGKGKHTVFVRIDVIREWR